ncbi:MAG: transposase [Thiobacillus sp.]
MAHSNIVTELAAGMKALPDTGTSFAHTQALWRFLANERVSAEGLSGPLLAMARAEVPEHCDRYALAVHDWSRLNYGGHTSKKDRLQMTHKTDIGYELQSSLLVSDRDGAPLVAPAQNLATATGVLSSNGASVAPPQPHLDELGERMTWLEKQDFGKPLVHIVDREADSVAHMRRWSAAGSAWLVRVKEGSRVRFGGRDARLGEVGNELVYTPAREVEYQGRPATQWLASTGVVLTRKAKSMRTDASGKRVAAQAGVPLPVRLVVSRICDENGRVLAQWYLLADVPEDVPAQTLALWYYYRWRIESYFKLLKQAGHQLERWEQETGAAIFKRLLIVGQACALAWRVMRAEGEFAQQVKTFLVRLSGRQMKRARPVTPSALLDGLFKLFMMIETLEHYTLDELKQFAKFAIFQQGELCQKVV